MLNEYTAFEAAEPTALAFDVAQVGYFEEYDKKTLSEQEQQFSEAIKKIIIGAQDPGVYAHELHAQVNKDWKENTAWEGAMSGDFSQTGSHQIGDFVDVKSLS